MHKKVDKKITRNDVHSFYIIRSNENLIFSFILCSQQKKKRQATYEGIRYDKLETSGDVTSILKPKSTKLLISTDDVELNHEKLQRAYDELQENELQELDDDEEEESEETRFINQNRSSFYTSSERTWSAINSQIIL